MADNNYEHPGFDEPEGGSPPEGDFPANFFEETAEQPPASLTPHETSPERPGAPVPPPYPEVQVPPPSAIGPPSAYKAPAVAPMEDERIKMSAFPPVLGVAMIAVLIAAWLVHKQLKEAPAATPAPAASATAEAPPAPATTPATTEITNAIDAKLKDLAGKLDELTAEVDANQAKLNDLPKPVPAPDLKPIEAKLDDLAKSVAAVSPLGDKVGKLGDHFGSVDGELKTIKGELAALKDDIRKAAAAAAAAAAKPAYEPKPAAEETATAMNGGVDLFKAGKYPQADEVFKKLVASNPKDARAYYYAALTHGITTNDWQGETLAIATKGAELEKSGSPKASEVDAAFADLPPNLKPWVTFFRKSAK